MKKTFTLLLVSFITLSALSPGQAADSKSKPLLVLGGCCHDYKTQKTLLKTGIESRINAVVDLEFSPDTTTGTTFSRYKSADWAKGYDVVIHDECSASVTDPAYVKRILDAHRAGIPAVNLHCAMHCYRWGNYKEPVKIGDDNASWYEMLGIQSTAHGPKSPIDISYIDKKNPIVKGLGDWTTINEELYNNVHIFPSAHALAKGHQIQKPRKKKGRKANPNAKGVAVETVVVWTNEYGPKKTRIFSTTIGHNNETVADDRYLDLVARGLLWATHHLNKDGTAADGYGK